jgi:hypothetical protein
MQEQAIGPAPAVTLKANGHGRALTFNALGTPALLVCVARESADQAGPVTRAVRERYPEASELLIISLADARAFPKLIRKVAEQIMKSSYNNAVSNLQPGRKPEDYVLIVPDWDGAVLRPLGIEDVSKQIAVVGIDRKGDVVGMYQGEDVAAQALELASRAVGA